MSTVCPLQEQQVHWALIRVQQATQPLHLAHQRPVQALLVLDQLALQDSLRQEQLDLLDPKVPYPVRSMQGLQEQDRS